MSNPFEGKPGGKTPESGVENTEGKNVEQEPKGPATAQELEQWGKDALQQFTAEGEQDVAAVQKEAATLDPAMRERIMQELGLDVELAKIQHAGAAAVAEGVAEAMNLEGVRAKPLGEMFTRDVPAVTGENPAFAAIKQQAESVDVQRLRTQPLGEMFDKSASQSGIEDTPTINPAFAEIIKNSGITSPEQLAALGLKGKALDAATTYLNERNNTDEVAPEKSKEIPTLTKEIKSILDSSNLKDRESLKAIGVTGTMLEAAATYLEEKYGKKSGQ